MRFAMLILSVLCGLAWNVRVGAQSSSLYLQENVTPVAAAQPQTRDGQPNLLSPAIARTSFTAVALPKPRKFAKHDLITIIVRESTENDSKSSLDTEKDSSFDAELSQFPNLAELIKLQLIPSRFDNGTPRVGLSLSNEFEGEGNFKRRDTFTTRLTAEIIDVKPNGLLVVEARKFIRTNKETVNVVLSGTARTRDIAADNTILSTNLHNLRLVKDHDGELRKATKKGVITQVFEGLFGP